MENNQIRLYMKQKRIPLWEVALKVGIGEATITRWLRTPLSGERYLKITSAIKEIENERKHDYE